MMPATPAAVVLNAALAGGPASQACGTGSGGGVGATVGERDGGVGSAAVKVRWGWAFVDENGSDRRRGDREQREVGSPPPLASSYLNAIGVAGRKLHTRTKTKTLRRVDGEIQKIARGKQNFHDCLCQCNVSKARFLGV